MSVSVLLDTLDVMMAVLFLLLSPSANLRFRPLANDRKGEEGVRYTSADAFLARWLEDAYRIRFLLRGSVLTVLTC